MFNKIYYNQLRNAEFLQLMRFIEQLINEYGIAILIPLYDILVKKNNTFESNFKATLKHPLTNEIHLWDDKRDGTFNNFFKIIDGNRGHSNTSMSDAANLIYIVFKNHGPNVAKLKLNEETAVLDSFITEIESTPVLSAAITTLNLQIWIDDLKTYNTKCSNLLKERNIEGRPKQSSYALKKEIMDTYNEISLQIMGNIIVKTEGDFEGLKNDINSQINKIQTGLNL